MRPTVSMNRSAHPIPSMSMSGGAMRVGIVIIATGRYIAFVKTLVASLEAFFLPDHEKRYFLFTDAHSVPDGAGDIHKITITRGGFPHDTLMRYRMIASLAESGHAEHVRLLYYFDADMKVVAPVGDEFIPPLERPLIAVSHPGFWRHQWLALLRPRARPVGRGTPERRPISTACIGEQETYRHYVCGGVQGGLTTAYLDAATRMSAAIDTDERNGVVAVWHDESHWNRFVASNLRSVSILPPDYCYPESGKFHVYGKRILALNKDHAFYRSGGSGSTEAAAQGRNCGM